jgi:acyl-coenzyme A thioesterase PaaI-like protein
LSAPANTENVSVTPTEQNDIRQRTLRALARNRIPGYNFAGNFLELDCRRFDRDGVVFDLEPGPHCVDTDGKMYLAAVTFLADMALAAASRAFVDPSARTATLLLRIDFTGIEPRGRLTANARSDGFSSHAALSQANCVGSIRAAGGEVAHMSGTWVKPPAPGGRALDPLPWERKKPVPVPALSPADLDPFEKNVMRRVEQVLRHAHHGGFLRNLWGPKVLHTPRGAASRFTLGLHVGNRVGHVQGGLTLNLALMTAIGAVPHHPLLTAVSAWYISPGQGEALTSHATVLQKGRNVAVVRTEVFAAGRKLVLEVISNHAIPAGH